MVGYLSNYYKNFSECQQRLLAMSTMPLLDGFYVSMLGSGQLDNVWNAIQFGCVAFSGGACISALAEDKAHWRSKLAFAFFVYVLVDIGATLMALFKPQMEAFFPSNLHYLTASFLIALAFAISNWRLPLRLDKLFNCQGTIGAIGAFLLLCLVSNIQAVVLAPFQIQWNTIINVNIACVAAFLLTATGIIFGAFIHNVENFDMRPFQWGQSVSLLLIVLSILGIPVNSAVTLAPIIAGLWAGAIKTYFDSRMPYDAS